MEAILQYFHQQPAYLLWLLFLIENIAVCLFSLALGNLILSAYQQSLAKPTPTEYWLCLLTVILNTAITYAGFYLWQRGYITFSFSWSWGIIPQFVMLFIAMDLLMFIFHFIIHQKHIFRLMHRLHHEYHDPSPIDLYVLHPIETIGFGTLWLILIALYHFNIYAVIIYLVVNVISGIVGHLGFEPIPEKTRRKFPFSYLGTSHFHHTHHNQISHNYGFYTTVWDKLFNTYKD